jgi:hypothetical protein
MWYYKIPSGETGRRTAERLMALKEHLRGADGVPPRKDETILLATWNIREFDSPAYGRRGPEPLFYIAEIISHFDLVAIQEVREDLAALRYVCKTLGSEWDYLVTDVTEGTAGNRERMAFLFDTRKVRFGGVAGEVAIPPVEKKGPDGKKTVYEPSRQLVRSPYICGFQAGWARFMLCTVHVIFGEDVKDDPRRVEEVRQIAVFLADRARGKSTWSRNLVLLGDFNIFSRSDVTLKQITDAGFIVPQEIRDLGPTSTGSRERYYDQIAFLPSAGRFESTGRAGVFDFFKTVYRDEDEAVYAEAMGESYLVSSSGKIRTEAGKTSYYRTYWRTFQMSDHRLMWIELKTDFSGEYLKGRAEQD